MLYSKYLFSVSILKPTTSIIQPIIFHTKEIFVVHNKQFITKKYAKCIELFLFEPYLLKNLFIPSFILQNFHCF